jgi:hypothetical protein
VGRSIGSDKPDRRLTRLLERPGRAWGLAGGLVALTVVAQGRSIAMPDMAFLLYAASRVVDGARLYRDVVEINPPLIVAINIPVVWVSRLTRLNEFLVYRVFVALMLGLLLLLTRALLSRYAVCGVVARRAVLLVACVSLFPLAGQDYGEREQVVLALMLPYLALAAARLLGRDVRPREAAGIGALTGVALALKPHFALAWVAIEVYVRARDASGRYRLTPEVASAGLVVITYAAGVVLVTPEYVQLVRDLGPAYATYLRDPFYRLLVTGPGAALVWFSLLAAIAARHATQRPEQWWLLWVAVMGFFLAGTAQEKGLRYHFYPAFALALILLVAVAAEARAAAAGAAERLYARIAVAVVAAVVLVAIGRTTVEAAGGSPSARRERAEFLALANEVRERAKGHSIGVFSYNIRSAFPLVNYAGVPLASRFPHWWLFPTSYWSQLHEEGPVRYRRLSEMDARERYFFEATRQDLLSADPRVILVLRPARDLARNGLRRLHYVAYLSRDPALATFLAQFRLVGIRGEYELYERVAAGAPHLGPPPSSAPGVGDARLARVTEFQLGLLDGETIAGMMVFAVAMVWAWRGRSSSTAMVRP